MRQVVHSRPQMPQRKESLALKHSRGPIQYKDTVPGNYPHYWKSDLKEVHGNLLNPLFEKEVRGQNILGALLNSETISHTLH